MSAVQRFFNVRREEVAPLFVAALYFFVILTALNVLRPARDALGMRSGLDAIRWLFIGTALVTLAVNPMFGWLVSRFRRMVFITATYLFFAISLVGFYLLIAPTPQAGGTGGRVFYVWQRVQPVRHHAVLGPHGRPLHAGAEQGASSARSRWAARWAPSSGRGSPACWPSRSARPRCCSSQPSSSAWPSWPPGWWPACSQNRRRTRAAAGPSTAR